MNRTAAGQMSATGYDSTADERACTVETAVSHTKPVAIRSVRPRATPLLCSRAPLDGSPVGFHHHLAQRRGPAPDEEQAQEAEADVPDELDSVERDGVGPSVGVH